MAAIHNGWAKVYIEQLIAGQTVEFRPRGNSMSGKVESGQLCVVTPVAANALPKKGDIVLCQVGRSQYLHIINSVQGTRFQIANNHGRINGWVGIDNIFGILESVSK